MLFEIAERQESKKYIKNKEIEMRNKKKPLVTPVTIETITKDDIKHMSPDEIFDIFQQLIKEIYPLYPQINLDIRKDFEYIHRRNTYIQEGWIVSKGLETSYVERLEYLCERWYLSPKNIEKIIRNNPTEK